MAGGYPIILDLRNRLIVVVGGGTVAVRKVQGLLAAGAGRIRVVSPAICTQMPSGIEHVAEEYRSEHLAGAGLVFAATDSPAVNRAVVEQARRIGVLACRVDTDEEVAGDFAVPAVLRDGSLLVAVSSGSPALSARIRDYLAQMVDRRWARMADAMGSLRPTILARLSPSVRAEVFDELFSDAGLSELDRGGLDGLRRWLCSRYPQLKD